MPAKQEVILVTWKYMRMLTKHHMRTVGYWDYDPNATCVSRNSYNPRHKLDSILREGAMIFVRYMSSRKKI